MKANQKIKTSNHFHFIGIGGVSMSGLAKYFLAKGFSVSGSDNAKSQATIELQKLGAKIYIGHNELNVKKGQTIVYTSAINNTNPELKMARQLKLKILKRSEVLSKILKEYKNSICVSGSHGKTTCSAMLNCVFNHLNLSPTCFIGGNAKSVGNFMLGKSDIVVAEACEYQRNFLDLESKYKIVLNIDNDHLESFGNEENMKSDFLSFVKNSIAIINIDDVNSNHLKGKQTITFGKSVNAKYRAVNLKKQKNGYKFTLLKENKKIGRIKLGVLGEHNVYNALAVVSLCMELGLSFKGVKGGLKGFRSVERRMEYMGKLAKSKVYCDYAHHPNEIIATMKAMSLGGKKDLIIFQPHTYSRTRLLLWDFVEALKPMKNVVIYKTYPAREQYDYSGSESKLCNALALKSAHVPTLALNEKELNAVISLNKKVKRIVVLGAGDLYYFVKKMVEEGKNSQNKKT